MGDRGRGSVHDLLSEDDLRLVHALQVAPRAPWAGLGEVLQRSPQALSARWDRLHGSGRAWVAAYPGGRFRDFVFALAEVRCDPARRGAVIDELCADRRVVTVEESTHHLVLTVMTPDLDALSAFVLDDLARRPAVVEVVTHVMTGVHRDGSAWNLDALGAGEVHRLRTRHGTPRIDPAVSPPREVGALLDALVRDGRAPASEIARELGLDPSTVRRQLDRLLRCGLVSIRCEVAGAAVGHPVSCTWRARVAASDLRRTLAALETLAGLRLLASTTGTANLVLTVWARDLGQLFAVEQLLGDRLPWVDLVDSALNLRTRKRVGWLLDACGRSTGVVVAPSALSPRPLPVDEGTSVQETGRRAHGDP